MIRTTNKISDSGLRWRIPPLFCGVPGSPAARQNLGRRETPIEVAGCPAIAKPIGLTELIEAIEERLCEAA
jgi:hypothetical protein